MSDGHDYVTGTPHPNTKSVATFEFKRPSPGHTGGGYPRWRSTERRPHTVRVGSEDVFVVVHRLCAVAWCFPDDWTAADVLESEALVGADVHHELGAPSANIESELSLVEHGTHSEITQAQRRAWAEDRKERASVDTTTASDVCDRCGGEAEALAECPAWPGERRCLECATATANGEEIKL